MPGPLRTTCWLHFHSHPGSRVPGAVLSLCACYEPCALLEMDEGIREAIAKSVSQNSHKAGAKEGLH